MRQRQRQLRPELLAPAAVTRRTALSSSSLLWARRGAGLSLAGKKQSTVTPFFAALFPAHFAGGDAADDVASRRVSFVRRALSAKGETAVGGARTAGSKWSAAAKTASSSSVASLRPWHVIANLKHAVLFAMNDEENSQDKKAGGAEKDCSTRHQDDEDEATCLPRGVRKDEGKKCGDGKRHVAPSEIVRLVRHSIRIVEQKNTRVRAELMMADANAGGGTSRLQEMDDNLRDEKDVLRNVPRKVPKEALMSYFLGGDDGTGGAANSTLEPLRFALKQTMRSSAYAFHLTFEALLRQGQDHMAVELFRRWWRHNPHLFPIELGPDLGQDVPALLSVIRAEGDTTNLQRDIIFRRLAQIPYKKYTVTSALFTRVMKVALCLGIPALEEEFVLQELIYKGVYMACCASRAGNENGNVQKTEVSASHTDLHFHVFQENYEDWLVLIGAIAAAAVLERHAEDFWREKSGGTLYDRLVFSVREEYTTFITKACCPQLIQSSPVDFGATTKRRGWEPSKPLVVPGWTRLLFTTVLRCYEEAGVFHPSPVRRPGNTAALWREIHTRLIQQFPHVFHAANTVTTLLSFAALEEAAVSSLGTSRMSFSGKEEALRRWRLECLSEREEGNGSGSTFHEFTQSQALSDAPRTSRRLRARVLTAHSALSTKNMKEESVDKDPNTSDAEMSAPQLHWKHRELFGHALSVSTSQLSIPVFLTSQEVINYAEDAMDELEAARNNVIEIFREHASLPMLYPASTIEVSNSQERRSCGDILAEASQLSIFLFLRLVSLLSLMGEPPVAATEAGENEDGILSFSLVECIEEDILPYCHPSVAASLRRCCATYLSRSGVRGIRALVGEHQTLLEQLTEEAAVGRLLVGVLWGGENDKKTRSSSKRYSFGSGSLAWQVIAQHRQLIFCKDGRLLLEMIISHLGTLSIAIPDDYRQIACLSPYMHRVIADPTDAASNALSALRSELDWNPSPARHVYISLLELLSWVVEAKKKEEAEEGTPKGIQKEKRSDESEGVSTFNDDSGANLPTLSDTARHWHVVQSFFRTRSLNFKLFSPFLLERICLILVHSCPDVELIVTCLLALCQQPRRESGAEVAAHMDGESSSFFTPRLLTSLCCLLVMNGLTGNSVRQWRQKNGAPSFALSSACGDAVNKNTLREWHLSCFERMLPSMGHILKENGEGAEGFSAAASGDEDGLAVGTNETAQLLGSIVLDVLLTDTHWQSLKKDNYYVFLFVSAAEQVSTKGADEAAVPCKKSSFPLGVVLPSRQISSSHPSGVRQRVTKLRDALREMGAERRLQIRRSMSPVRRQQKGVLEAYSLANDGGEEEDDVENFFLHSVVGEDGVTTQCSSTWSGTKAEGG
ncbi:hypothetical protein MOQ_003631 [Trypanosoma cruzi marinkellei]|uniref:Uncharacterized protein n=1 Tax=Trypanosoma cruzi marinkellei TaxID=85056 RepID=K2N3N1_TRYCR|nr:hypothetical protein MOQ_003631 [Trypanosoma cruzi marinkellei]